MDNERIVLDIQDDEQININKKDILSLFKDLKNMPVINREKVYQDIVRDNINLPSFEFEKYYLNFCNYKGDNEKNIVIIKDDASDKYYYIYGENVFYCDIYDAQNVFYSGIAKETNQDYEYIYDTLIGKLNCYEAVMLSTQKNYLSNLDDFIEDNIYMFDAALKEKENKSKLKLKIK